MNKKTTSTTPAEETAVSTTATDGTTAVSTTGEPVTTQAPAADTAAPAVATPAVTTPAAVNNVQLPKDYLANGYYATTEKGKNYLRLEFVGEYADIMAKLLANMKPSDFNGLLREMKRNRKKSLPFEARMTAATEMLPKAMVLVQRKKAPALLVTFVKENLDHIHDDDDWFAFLRHLEAIAGYMAIMKGGDA